MKNSGHRAYAWGRVATLPFVILLELCARLRRGDSITDTLAWLNAFANGDRNRRQRFGLRPISSDRLLKFRRQIYPIYQDHLRELTHEIENMPVVTGSIRSGMIAGLPYAIRSEIAQRLVAGESGRSIVFWLNAQPVVIERMRKRFGGRLITEGSLSCWKVRHLKDYLRVEEARRHA